MTITEAVWIDAEHTGLKVICDGKIIWVPPDPENRHYSEILRSGINISEPTGG